MRLFKRKPEVEDDAVRCPECHERIPDGAVVCAMCGYELSDETAAPDGGGGERSGAA
jgi:hypothetical protein